MCGDVRISVDQCVLKIILSVFKNAHKLYQIDLRRSARLAVCTWVAKHVRLYFHDFLRNLCDLQNHAFHKLLVQAQLSHTTTRTRPRLARGSDD